MARDALSGPERAKPRRRVRAPRKGQPRTAVALHPLELDIEAFSEFAWKECEAVRAETRGVCALPQCSAAFNPMTAAQVYCSVACRVAEVAERRKVGLVAAPALLALREGKYEAEGSAKHRRFKKAWAYLGRLGTVWKQDRARRRKEARARDE